MKVIKMLSLCSPEMPIQQHVLKEGFFCMPEIEEVCYVP